MANTEQKISKWSEVPNYYIKHDNWTEEINGEAISKLKKLVSDLNNSFYLIDSSLSTNANIGSMLSNKNIQIVYLLNLIYLVLE